MRNASQPVLTEPVSSDAEIRLREFAHQLANTHSETITSPQKTILLEYLQSWEKALQKAHVIFKAMPAKDLPVSRAGEWMLDNYYIIKQTFRQIKKDLPVSFLNQLPSSFQYETSRAYANTGTFLGINRIQPGAD